MGCCGENKLIKVEIHEISSRRASTLAGVALAAGAKTLIPQVCQKGQHSATPLAGTGRDGLEPHVVTAQVGCPAAGLFVTRGPALETDSCSQEFSAARQLLLRMPSGLAGDTRRSLAGPVHGLASRSSSRSSARSDRLAAGI